MALSLSDVNRGSAPGDGTGETAYSAFGKVNTNNGLIETIVDSLAGRFWTIQNSSTTLALGGRYKANNHVGITLTLPATFAQTAGTLSDIWIMNGDDVNTVTIAPASGDNFFSPDVGATVVDDTWVLPPGGLAILSPRTSNTTWDLCEYDTMPQGDWLKSTGQTDDKYIRANGSGGTTWATLPIVKNNFNASVGPTNNDDVDDGYSIGSLWIDTVLDMAFVCVAHSPAGSAAWKTLSNDGLAEYIQHSLNESTAPTGTNDAGEGYTRGSLWFDQITDRVYQCIDVDVDNNAVWVELTNITTSGTFTPTILDNTLSPSESQTYTARTGVYRKHGDMVHFWITMTVNSLGSLTTTEQARIGALPFTSGSAVQAAVTVGYGNSLAVTAGHSVSGSIGTGVAYISLWKWSATTGSTALTLAELSTGGELIVSGSYLV